MAQQQRVVAGLAERVEQHHVRACLRQRGERRLGGVRLAGVLDVVVLGQPERDEARERLGVVAVEDADPHAGASV